MKFTKPILFKVFVLGLLALARGISVANATPGKVWRGRSLRQKGRLKFLFIILFKGKLS
jgi:hypothetical protein